MPDDTLDAKAHKLAAARKKLKEYQQRNNNVNENLGTYTNSSTVSIASNLSEHSDCELSTSNSGGANTQQTLEQPTHPSSGAEYFCQSAVPVLNPEPDHTDLWSLQNGQRDTSFQTFEVLIAENIKLKTELTKCRNVCRERELELEELRTEHGQTLQRLEGLQQHYQDQQKMVGSQQNENAELQHKLAATYSELVDQQSNLSEIEAQLLKLNEENEKLHKQNAEKCRELDMAQLRVRQLSNESNVNTDNRVETLTQTQYMYEQQIRDLQQMVTQLSQDKEQAFNQYQNYVATLKERYAELSEDNAQLKERERQLVDHVSGLERNIQKNLALQAQSKKTIAIQSQPSEIKSESVSSEELTELKEKIMELEFERHEYQLKIKSQHDELQLKEEKLAQLEEELARLQSNQPDQAKLLATIESDKVAASRALSQNMDLKLQLDELQKRFVQLTNEKLDLVNKLDAEEFANKEIRINYESTVQKLQANEERLKFKDEEMIRLSHENVDLQRSKLMLQQQVDRLQHYEAKVYHINDLNDKPFMDRDILESPSDGHDHDNDHQCKPDVGHHLHKINSGSDEVLERNTPLLPPAEAVEKLQSRFTTLISKVADLTEEKHSLEHLVLQLQSETETIGEYITLYQTQRRMLKQREYEKATQMRLLKSEREQLREKIDKLNKLVERLDVSVDLPSDKSQKTADSHDITEEHQLPPGGHNTESKSSKQILHKIQDIISEIKVNTEEFPSSSSIHSQAGHVIDHLNCCLGKFEVV